MVYRIQFYWIEMFCHKTLPLVHILHCSSGIGAKPGPTLPLWSLTTQLVLVSFHMVVCYLSDLCG